MDKCFICMETLDDTIFLPMIDEYFGQDISIFKNTFIIKDFDNYQFAYLLICDYCIDQYLKKHGKIFKYLRNRELGLK